MHRCLALIFLSVSLAARAQDGPYLFYRADSVISLTVRDGALQRVVGNPGHIGVSFSDHPDWDFDVPLRTTLVDEPCVWKQPRKMLVLSDIEGEFEAFRALLIANKVIDRRYRWTFGKGHLVICGDLFDRGKAVAQELWLLYKLEDEARAQGGYVHTLLGNHDIMNLNGDLRYVQAFYFDDARVMGLDYKALYRSDSELGRWLRTKNLIEKIGENLCLHGGVSPEVNALGWSLEDINGRCRPFYDKAAQAPAGVNVFFGRNAPFWYRGYFMDPRASRALIDSTLTRYGCKRIVVGHTIVDINVAAYYNGDVIGIDVDEHAGHRAGAMYRHGKWYVVDDKGNRRRLVYQASNDTIREAQIL